MWAINDFVRKIIKRNLNVVLMRCQIFIEKRKKSPTKPKTWASKLKIAEFRECLIRHRFSLYNHEGIAKPSAPIRFICQDATRASSSSSDGKESKVGELVSIFANKLSYSPADAISRDNLSDKVAELKKEILAQKEDAEKIEKILEEDGLDLFRRYSDGSAAVHLLKQLQRYPSLAMEVLWWRRKQLDHDAPMTVEEYSKGIAIASKMDNLDVAVELFKEAFNKGLKDINNPEQE